MYIEQNARMKFDIVGEFVPAKQGELEQEPSVEQKYQELVKQLGCYAILNEDFKDLFVDRIGNTDIRQAFEDAHVGDYR